MVLLVVLACVLASPAQAFPLAAEVLGASQGAAPLAAAERPAFYVDDVDGDDSNDGLSPQQAWQTVAEVNSNSFAPGDLILFRRGGVWRDELHTPNNDGTAARPIVYGAYGSGARPRITGFDVLTGWTLDAGSRYETTISPTPEDDSVTAVVENRTLWYTLESSAAAVDAAGEYFYDDATDTLYVQTSDGADPDTHSMEVSVRRYPVSICGSPFDRCAPDNIVFRDLHLDGGSLYGLFVNNASNVRAENLLVEYNGLLGVYFRDNPPTAVTDHWLVNSTVRFAGTDPDRTDDVDGCVTFEGTLRSKAIGNTIDTCYGPGIKVTAQVGQPDITDPLISRNSIRAATNGVHIFRATTPLVEYNRVFAGKDIGIFIGQDADDAIVQYNLVHDIVQISGSGGFNGIDVNSASDGIARNNTVYAVSGGSFILDEASESADGWTITNNVFDAEDNTDPVGVTAEVYTVFIDTGITGTVADRNLHYLPSGNESGNFISWVGNAYTTSEWSDFQTTESQEANGIGISTAASYQDLTNRDFLPAAGSPLIDAAQDVGGQSDVRGQVVPKGAGRDIGALERP